MNSSDLWLFNQCTFKYTPWICGRSAGRERDRQTDWRTDGQTDRRTDGHKQKCSIIQPKDDHRRTEHRPDFKPLNKTWSWNRPWSTVAGGAGVRDPQGETLNILAHSPPLGPVASPGATGPPAWALTTPLLVPAPPQAAPRQMWKLQVLPEVFIGKVLVLRDTPKWDFPPKNVFLCVFFVFFSSPKVWLLSQTRFPNGPLGSGRREYTPAGLDAVVIGRSDRWCQRGRTRRYRLVCCCSSCVCEMTETHTLCTHTGLTWGAAVES